MPTTVQFRRGTTAQNNSFTGAAGEITVNTSNNTLRVHDGSTSGGYELSPVASLTTANVTEVTNLYFTNARTYSNVTSVQFGSSNLTSNLVLNGVVTYSGSAVEDANIQVSNVTSNVTFNPYEQAVLYYAANSNTNAAVTVNFTGVGNLNAGNVLSATILLTNNATFNAYISAVQVDGSATSVAGTGGTVLVNGTPTGNTIRWLSGAPTSGSANIEAYSFSIFKQTTSSYLVLGSKSTFS